MMNAIQMRKSSLHNALMESLRTLKDGGSASYEFDRVEKYVWNCYLIVTSYCSDIPEVEDMECENHGIPVMILYVS